LLNTLRGSSVLGPADIRTQRIGRSHQTIHVEKKPFRGEKGLKTNIKEDKGRNMIPAASEHRSVQVRYAKRYEMAMKWSGWPSEREPLGCTTKPECWTRGLGKTGTLRAESKSPTRDGRLSVGEEKPAGQNPGHKKIKWESSKKRELRLSN